MLSPDPAAGLSDRDRLMAEQGEVRVGLATIRYRVIRSQRRHRTMEIVVDRREGVRVSVPQHTPRDEVASFVMQRAGWIARHVAATQRSPVPAWVGGEVLPFLGDELRLAVVPAAVPRATAFHDRQGARLLVHVPDALDANARRAAVRDAVRAWYRASAERVLRARVSRWAEYLRLFPSRVIVKDQRRRWGSCARDGTIRLNWRVVMAAPALVDYVVVHELMHLLVRSHSPGYWSRVRQVLPDYVGRRDRLRQVATTLDL